MTKQPSSKRISKRRVQEAMTASLLGQATDEHQQVLQAIADAPGSLLGVSTREYQKLQSAYSAIHGQDQELLVVAQALMLCGLPYRPTKETHHVREARTSKGRVRLVVTATDPDTPLPYGKDRVVLAWVTTKALRDNNPVVSWESSSEFFDLMGLNKDGRTYRAFWESWRRLSQATFKIQIIQNGRDSGRHAPIFERWDLPTLGDERKEATGLVRLPGMNYSVELGTAMWEHLRENPVPLRLEIMQAFQDEPKAWDFVSFVCWRSWLCERAKSEGIGNPVARIPFAELLQQLGSVDKDHKRLRKTLKDILDRLGTMWPEMQARFIRAGVLEVGPPIGGVHPVKPR